MRLKRGCCSPTWRQVLGLLVAAVLLSACATPKMEAQWRDPQAAAGSMRGKTVLVVCRAPDLTLERVCEDRLAVDAQAIGIRVVRAEPPTAAMADPAADPVYGEALWQSARALRADAVLAMRLEWTAGAAPPSGGSVGVGVGGGRGTWGGGTSGAIGITLPLGGYGPALASGTSLVEAASGKVVWSARAKGSGAAGELAQVGELSRLTTEALRGAALF